MPTTIEALVVLAISLFPGAMFLWALERVVGKWDFGLSDRILRFVVFSAMFHAPAFPLTAWVLRDHVFGATGPDGLDSMLVVWMAFLAYTFVPVLIGSWVGRSARKRTRLSEWFTGRDPAPRAWDNLFLLEDQTGWVRLKLKSGSWIGGVWTYDEDRGLRSYAGGYPHPADLFLAETAEVDPADGSFRLTDEDEPVLQAPVCSSGGTRSSTLCSRRGDDMAKLRPRPTRSAPVQKRGGYSAGKKPISQLKPPPKGPAPGAKPGASAGGSKS